MAKVTREVVQLRDALDKALAKDDVARVSDILGQLDKVDITVEIMAESKIGATVSKLKKHSDAQVAGHAKGLVKRWKQLAQAAGVESSSRGSDHQAPAPSAAAGATSIRAPRAKDLHRAGSTDSFMSEASSPRVGGGRAAPAKAQEGKQAQAALPAELQAVLEERLKVRHKFQEVFIMPEEEGGSPPDGLKAAEAACGVEKEVNAKIPFVTQKDEYLSKVRSLIFNLKKNSALRSDTVSGAVSHEELVAMSPTDMLSTDKRQEIQQQAQDLADARRLDWTEKNQDAINKQCGIDSVDGMFECGRCKSKKTTYFQKQTRSADEPMTTFVTCNNCGKKWKFC